MIAYPPIDLCKSENETKTGLEKFQQALSIKQSYHLFNIQSLSSLSKSHVTFTIDNLSLLAAILPCLFITLNNNHFKGFLLFKGS